MADTFSKPSNQQQAGGEEAGDWRGGVSGCVTRLRLPDRRQTLKLSLLCCLVKKNPSGCHNDTFVVLVAKVCCRLLIGCSENYAVTRDRIRVVGSDDRPRVR